MGELKPVYVGQFQTYQRWVICAVLKIGKTAHSFSHLIPTLVGEEKTCEDRFHIAIIFGAKQFLAAVRSHWNLY